MLKEAGENSDYRLLDYQVWWLVMTKGKINVERSQIQDEKENHDIHHTEHKRVHYLVTICHTLFYKISL